MNDEAVQLENETLVFSCTAHDKRFQVQAYTWKSYPKNGVRYDIYVDDSLAFVNADMSSVMGLVYELLRESMLACVPNHQTRERRRP